jgi:hypothetical protein
MRRIPIAIALLALLASPARAGVAAAPQTDRAIAELAGPVKSVRLEVLHFDAYTGKLDTERMPKLEDWYDRAGNLIEEKYHTADFIDDKHPRRLDAQTYLIKSNMGDKKRHRVFDAGGMLIEETIYILNRASWQILEASRFKYDAHGRRVETDDLRDGKVEGFTLIERDGTDNIAGLEFHYNRSHAPFPRTAYENYKFDRHGNWTERRVYEFDPDSGKPPHAFFGIEYQVIEYYTGP